MGIYRGAGGTGDAVADSSSEALLVRNLAIEVQADADAAAASAAAALVSENNAAGSAVAADASADAAAISETNAATSAADAVSTLSSSLLKANNLSDLTSVSTARTNLGLVASATTDTTNASNISSGTLDATRLATSGVTANTYGSGADIPVLTVDSKGRVTAASTVAVQGGQYFGTAATKAIAYNASTINENITMTENGFSVGPISVGSGYAVTVNTGKRWVVL